MSQAGFKSISNDFASREKAVPCLGNTLEDDKASVRRDPGMDKIVTRVNLLRSIYAW